MTYVYMEKLEKSTQICHQYPAYLEFRFEYHIYLAIRRGFPLSRMTTNNLVCPRNFAIIQVFPFLNSSKDLDPSYKTDLDF